MGKRFERYTSNRLLAIELLDVHRKNYTWFFHRVVGIKHVINAKKGMNLFWVLNLVQRSSQHEAKGGVLQCIVTNGNTMWDNFCA